MLIDEVLAEYRADRPHWSASLVADLEIRSPGRAFDWGVACMKSLLESISTVGRDKLLGWLAELADAGKASVGSDILGQGQRIWHAQRDIPHTALSHLYAALAYRSEGNSVAYRTSLIRAVRVMGDHEFYRRTEVATPLALYAEFAAKTG